jgi:uncharacterized membrane protein YjjP (DUF1212 family)
LAPLPLVQVDPREELLREVALALHKAGAPAWRLEEAVAGLGVRVGLEARVFSTPTAIYAGFGPESAARTVLLRAAPADVDLGKLAEVDALVQQVLSGELDAPAAVSALRARLVARKAWGAPAQVAAFGLASGSAAVLLGGGASEVAGAAVTGVAVGAVAVVMAQNPRLNPLVELVGAFVAAVVGGWWSRLVPSDAALVTLTGLIVLFPGLSFTTALLELASRHLVSGTARVVGSFATFATLGLGAVAGFALLPPMAAAPPIRALPVGWGPVALAVAAVAFTVLMQARRRDLLKILLGAGVAYAAAQAAHGQVPAPLDAAIGALTLGLFSNTVARFGGGPASVPLVPGLFMLVPGSIGFRSLVDLMQTDLTYGLEYGITALSTGVALAAGVLVAGVVLPARRFI